MRKLYLTAWAVSAALACGGSGVLAADSAADAKAELERKQKERAAARAVKTEITVGELEDLRDDVRRLELENAALKGKAANAAAAGAKPPVKRFTAIEVGMTRDELLTFVKSRGSIYKIAGMNVEAGGVHTEREQFIESSTSSRDTATLTDSQRLDATGRKGAVGTPTQKNEALDKTISTDSEDSSSRTIERRRMKDKKEKIKVDVIGSKSAVVGTERSAAGSSPRMGRVKAVTGAYFVSLTNDVVTGIETQGSVK